MYQTKDEKLLPYKHIVGTLKAWFVHITFEKIPREKNRVVDSMDTLAYFLELLDQHEQYEFLVEEVVQPTFTQPKSLIICLSKTPNFPLYESITTYIIDNIIPSNLSWNQKCNFIW